MAFCRSTSTQELWQCFTQTTYDGVDYNEHRANVHLSPRGAHWKAFSARYFIPPLTFSVHCINISIHSPCIVLTLDPDLTVIETQQLKSKQVLTTEENEDDNQHTEGNDSHCNANNCTSRECGHCEGRVKRENIEGRGRQGGRKGSK